MKYSWRQPRHAKGSDQVPSMSGCNGKNNGGLMTGLEKGFSEAFLFMFSVVLHLTHSLEGKHGCQVMKLGQCSCKPITNITGGQ
jgi:hypothetical protein